MSECSWFSGIHNAKCKFPGVFSQSLSGGGPWKCFWHHTLGRGYEDQRAGDEIVKQSEAWDGSAGQYMEWRFEAAKRLGVEGGDGQEADEGQAPQDHRGRGKEEAWKFGVAQALSAGLSTKVAKAEPGEVSSGAQEVSPEREGKGGNQAVSDEVLREARGAGTGQGAGVLAQRQEVEREPGQDEGWA